MTDRKMTDRKDKGEPGNAIFLSPIFLSAIFLSFAQIRLSAESFATKIPFQRLTSQPSRCIRTRN